MKHIGRKQLRGKRLMRKCRKAKISKNEYPNVDGCYGLCDWSDSTDDDCLHCGAYVYNIRKPYPIYDSERDGMYLYSHDVIDILLGDGK